jgi:prepilin signal peptidase PulO-like enzyme (type II secretory pathway)
MVWLILFVFGAAIGSFLNVVALRYDGEKFLFSPKLIGGRSHCPHCKKILQWFELIPLISFIIQGGKCRNCGARISFRYPIMELISGAIFVFVPLRLSSALYLASHSSALIGFSVIWIIAFETLLLIGYIDLLLGIIPDELNITLGILGLIEIFFIAQTFGIGNPSFFGPYATIFGLQSNVWVDHIVGALFGVGLFGGLVAVTRGKGMGMGDVKLALPLGLLFGWPDIMFLTGFAFVIGGIYGMFAVTVGKKTMKSAVPFGPFLVLGAAIAFFWGSALFNWYFHMIGL